MAVVAKNVGLRFANPTCGLRTTGPAGWTKQDGETNVADGHERIETNIGLMVILVLIVSSFGGLVTILPLFSQGNMLRPVEGVEPYPALQLAGRDVYVREGCYVCHSQMIRPFRAETERYGHYSVAGEFVYDRPFQWGSRRAGPDLHRVGGRYSDEWHRVHLMAPRSGRVAPGDYSPEALTRSGQGDFHHPAPPLMCLVAILPISAPLRAAGEAGSVPAVCRTVPT